MSFLKKKYREKILEEIILRYFAKNKVPSSGSLVSEYEELKNQYPLLGDAPFLNSLSTKFERWEHMSADKYNDFFSRLYKDLTILFEANLDLLKRISEIEQNWNLYYQNANKVLDKVENRADNLLFVNRDTLGFFSYLYDNFTTLENVDVTNSTARINTSQGLVDISPDLSNTARRLSRVDLSRASVKVSYTAAHPFISSKSTAAGVVSNDIVRDSNRPWFFILTTSKSKGSASADIIIDLGAEFTFSSVEASMYFSTRGTAAKVVCFYSKEGRDWIKAGLNPVQLVTRTGRWDFKEVSAKYLRFLISKDEFDQTTPRRDYVWTFGFNLVSILNPVYISASTTTKRSAELVTSVRNVVRGDGALSFFNKIYLEACELLPPDTDITYEVSIDSGDTYIPIGNALREDGVSPIVNFGDKKRVISYIDGKRLSSTSGTGVVATDFSSQDLDTLLRGNDCYINYDISEADLENFENKSLAVFRNVGRSTGDTVRDRPTGWRFALDDSAMVSTSIFITSRAGKTIDFGSSQVVIDGSPRQGSVFLSSGKHTIVTNRQNWVNLQTSSPYSNDEEVRGVDPLFPYNHKLLIEGYPYADSDYNGVYGGVDIYAEYVLDFLPFSQYANLEEIDYTKYSYLVRNGNLYLVVKLDSNYTDYVNEQFDYTYVLNDQQFNSLKLKATLTTFDAKFSPILKDYTIKVG